MNKLERKLMKITVQFQYLESMFEEFWVQTWESKQIGVQKIHMSNNHVLLQNSHQALWALKAVLQLSQ